MVSIHGQAASCQTQHNHDFPNSVFDLTASDAVLLKEAREPGSDVRGLLYNYCWQTRMPGKSGEKRPSAAMMAGLTSHVWDFGELFDEALRK